MTRKELFKIYQLPFVNHFGGIGVASSNDIYTLMWMTNINDAYSNLIIEVLNEKRNLTNPELSFRREGVAIIASVTGKKDTVIALIRGWGKLTGTGGGIGLSEEKATEIQNKIGDYIIERLNDRTILI